MFTPLPMENTTKGDSMKAHPSHRPTRVFIVRGYDNPDGTYTIHGRFTPPTHIRFFLACRGWRVVDIQVNHETHTFKARCK